MPDSQVGDQTGPNPTQKVWLITGCSSGFGRFLVDHLLSRSPNDYIIATSRPRSIHYLSSLLDPSQNPHWKRIRLIELDVTDPLSTIEESIRKAIYEPFEDGSDRAGWGRVDVLVNNAGFGPAGTIEEGGVGALEYCFGTNTWGPVKVTNAVVPFMRGKGSGMIVFIGSRSAYKTGPPVSLACSIADIFLYRLSLAIRSLHSVKGSPTRHRGYISLRTRFIRY